MSQKWSDRQTCRALGQMTLKANCWLAVWWFCFFGAAIAVGLPGSLEERFANLLLLGVLPALGLILSGFILDQALKQSCKLCQIIAASGQVRQYSFLRASDAEVRPSQWRGCVRK